MDELIQEMISAYDADIRSLEIGEPGLAKLQLLQKVEELTAKQATQDSFIDAGGLGAIREWLRLLPDNSLPNLTLRTSLLQILNKLLPSITIENLKDSKIGFALRDMIFHEEESVANKRIASEIAENWLRQVFGRSSGHTSTKATDEEMRTAVAVTARNNRRTYRQEEVEGEGDDEGERKRKSSAFSSLLKHTRDSAQFTIQPVSRVQKARGPAIAGGAVGERIAKTVLHKGGVRRSTGSTKVSVEGRGLQ